MPKKPVRLARSTSLGGIKTGGIDGDGENVNSLIRIEKQERMQNSLYLKEYKRRIYFLGRFFSFFFEFFS